jgi:SAM-dependent methyltransferase
VLDAVVCREVLEHIPEPAAVLAEFRRTLRQCGTLYLTTPLLWEVHEHPYDFYRYTPYALRRLLTAAGFAVGSIAPRAGRYRALGASLFQAGRLLPPFPGGLAGRAARVLLSRFLCLALAPAVGTLDRFDHARDPTIGYCCHAIAQQRAARG